MDSSSGRWVFRQLLKGFVKKDGRPAGLEGWADQELEEGSGPFQFCYPVITDVKAVSSLGPKSKLETVGQLQQCARALTVSAGKGSRHPSLPQTPEHGPPKPAAEGIERSLNCWRRCKGAKLLVLRARGGLWNQRS